MNKNDAQERKAMTKQITSPEQLSDRLKITNPSVWIVLLSAIALLSAVLAWSAIGMIETRTEAVVVVENRQAVISVPDAWKLAPGMPVRVSGEETEIISVEVNETGNYFGTATLLLPDGTYAGIVVVEMTHPINLLLEGR